MHADFGARVARVDYCKVNYSHKEKNTVEQTLSPPRMEFYSPVLRFFYNPLADSLLSSKKCTIAGLHSSVMVAKVAKRWVLY